MTDSSARTPPSAGGTRALTPDEADLLTRLLAGDFPGAESLRRQVASARVTGPWAPGSASLELSVSDSAGAASIADGPVPGVMWACSPSGEPTGTLLLWVSGGYLSAIEYGWVTDEPPTTLPLAAAVRDLGGDGS